LLFDTTTSPAALLSSTVPQEYALAPVESEFSELPQTDTERVPAVKRSDRGIASGEKAKARDLLEAIRTVKRLERQERVANLDEQAILRRFAGFGPLARSIFRNPTSGRYKDASWQALGEELEALLTAEEYASAKQSTFNAFYTSPTVIEAIHRAIRRLGVPEQSLLLEPGCGSGNFLSDGPPDNRFIGVELDLISGQIARALHPRHDIRIESFQDTKLPLGRLDAVVGNVPFADLKLEYQGRKLSLHDYFFAKSVAALRPGGVLALVTTHFTLDKQNAAVRELLAEQADFVGAVRLPSNAFAREGTAVVTDIVFLRKRADHDAAQHTDADWLRLGTLEVDGREFAVNRYFLNRPEMVLGAWSTKDTLYGEGYSLLSNGDLAEQLERVIERLPEFPALHTLPFPEPAGERPANQQLEEGSFWVRADRALCQVVDGQAQQVVYGGRKLTADDTLTGRRLAALVGLRDRARRVLKSQNDDWPETERLEARDELNRAYDRFVLAYGPINKTTFGATRDGNVIRRMPNLVKFREDPDAMLVMSLEDYDEITGQAAEAAILLQDVVGRTPPLTHVASAEEGLLASLNQRGVVDLELIERLYGKPQPEIIAELGELIYQVPGTGQWQPADLYLSGNVRAKLAEAERAGPAYARNVEALQAVQPEDVLPGDIDAKLGSPWVPGSDVTAFAAEVFGVAPSTVRVAYLAKEALWSLEAGHAATASAAACSDYGTARANGVWLFELALNLKSPVIYDTTVGPNGEERVVNQADTLAAREKQKLLKERFQAWIFADPDRTERLVRLYNDTYNNLRPRHFDGSHLDYPGMNQAIRLRPHQHNAVWRGMSSGNTLLAHCVGAGKTFTMAATGMKLKQAGLIQKPMYVVPNHLLEQFAREFLQLYPNAKLLVAAKEDLAKDRRKMLTAKIASGRWDGIIVTHSSFERIGMSREYQKDFLLDQIAAYDALLIEHAANRGGSRNLIKTIEKQKAARAARLKDLLAEDKKDDGLVFDELGVDHVFIDEAHYFKNLETPSKMERVAGIQTGGSERAFDVFMKARYLDSKQPRHGVTFATGTPISNTMVELYTMQRYLDPAGLESRGLEHFDAWAATFGEVVESMEIAPDGASLRARSRFAKFTNLPELQQMFRSFADVQTAEMLNLPRPQLLEGKPIIVACPMSEDQQRLQAELVERYERLRRDKVDPREDNALAITTDGRQLATDARMLMAEAEDHPGSKVNALAEHVVKIWRESAPVRGAQLIFADLGVNSTPWGYSVYGEIVGKLIERGIPREEIACIGDADSDAKKQSLFERVRNGSVRVLLGSTQKMGTGTNVQKRLVALHHLDAPWKPAEVEQREGRILRQGNENAEVAIYRYVTEGSFDAYMWQALETKARFISQVITGDNALRQAEDVGGQELSYAEVKAIASGNPAVLTLAEADAELQRLAILQRNHLDEQFLARKKVRDLPVTIERLQERIRRLKADGRTLLDHACGMGTIDSQQCGHDRFRDALAIKLEKLPERVRESRRYALGTYRGLEFGLVLHPGIGPEVYLQGEAMRTASLSRNHQGPRAITNALERLAVGYVQERAERRQELVIAEAQLHGYRIRLGKVFAEEGYAKALSELRDQLRVVLSRHAGSRDAPRPDSVELAERITGLRAAPDAVPRARSDGTPVEQDAAGSRNSRTAGVSLEDWRERREREAGHRR
jgi:N12 class adenine-specific DNA methylase